MDSSSVNQAGKSSLDINKGGVKSLFLDNFDTQNDCSFSW